MHSLYFLCHFFHYSIALAAAHLAQKQMMKDLLNVLFY